MRQNQTELIKDSSRKIMTAKGCKIREEIVSAIAQIKGVSRYHKDFQEKKEKIRIIIDVLVFYKKVSYSDLSDLRSKLKLGFIPANIYPQINQ